MKIVTTFILLLSTFIAVGQNSKREVSEKTIDVTGIAEMSVPPNEVVFKINLVERMEGKVKVTIEKQELSLKEALSRIGINVQKDLKVFDITSNISILKRKVDEMAIN